MLDRSMPVAPLAIIALPSATELGQKVSQYISSFRKSVDEEGGAVPFHDDYYKDNYLLNVSLERFLRGRPPVKAGRFCLSLRGVRMCSSW